jgi:hypothetical protein
VSTLIPGVLACPSGTIKAPEPASRGVSVILRVGDLRRDLGPASSSVSEISQHVSSQILSIANKR